MPRELAREAPCGSRPVTPGRAPTRSSGTSRRASADARRAGLRLPAAHLASSAPCVDGHHRPSVLAGSDVDAATTSTAAGARPARLQARRDRPRGKVHLELAARQALFVDGARTTRPSTSSAAPGVVPVPDAENVHRATRRAGTARSEEQVPDERAPVARCARARRGCARSRASAGARGSGLPPSAIPRRSVWMIISCSMVVRSSRRSSCREHRRSGSPGTRSGCRSERQPKRQLMQAVMNELPASRKNSSKPPCSSLDPPIRRDAET